MRSKARETVFKYLFAELFNTANEEFFAVLIKEEGLNAEEVSFAKELLNYSKSKISDYLDKIGALAIGYEVDRIYIADKCALILGMSELDNYPDTPKVVIIDEAVKLSAKFSTEKSTDFLNGILSRYSKEVRND